MYFIVLESQRRNDATFAGGSLILTGTSPLLRPCNWLHLSGLCAAKVSEFGEYNFVLLDSAGKKLAFGREYHPPLLIDVCPGTHSEFHPDTLPIHDVAKELFVVIKVFFDS